MPRFGEKAEPSGVMRGLALVLSALLVGRGAGLLQRGPEAAPTASPKDITVGTEQPGVTLTCYRCFKATKNELCTPAVCASTDRVCVSHAVTFTFKSRAEVVLSKGCAPRCPNTNMMYEWQLGVQMHGKIVRQCCSRSLCNAAPPTLGRPWALLGGLLFLRGLSLLRAMR